LVLILLLLIYFDLPTEPPSSLSLQAALPISGPEAEHDAVGDPGEAQHPRRHQGDSARGGEPAPAPAPVPRADSEPEREPHEGQRYGDDEQESENARAEHRSSRRLAAEDEEVGHQRGRDES